MRYFNKEGECDPSEHYMLPAAARLPEAREWVRQKRYFVIHAPRQSGKTTSLKALADELTAAGSHVALRFSCERGKLDPDDVGLTELRVLDAIAEAASERDFPQEWLPPDPWPDAVFGGRIVKGLKAWARQCPLPLVLIFDEIDSLEGKALGSILSQIREGFSWRPDSFPSSIALCGMRHVRHYKTAAGSSAPVDLDRGSPFNSAVTFRLANFTIPQVAELYAQHTAETGQEFAPEAVNLAWELTEGQPWLVNALAAEVTGKMRLAVPGTITGEHVASAAEQLIEDRAIHLDTLAYRLKDPGVRKVIEPIIAGTHVVTGGVYSDSISYARDLGLIAPDKPVRIACPIYREVITRVLGDEFEENIITDPHSLLLPDGRLDVPAMLEDFTAFWLENGEWMTADAGYNEAGAQIVFMAYLNVIANGDALVAREYGIGTGRVDILLRRPYDDGRQVQREAFELKVWWDKSGDPLEKALPQLDKYLARFRLDRGTLIIFDRRTIPAPVEERSGTETITSPGGRTITLLRR